MADDRKRRPHDRFARPPSAIPVEIDPELTPAPTDLVELTEALWPLRHTPEQLATHGAAIRGYTAQVERHEAEIKQWSGVAKQCVADIQHATRLQAELGAHMEAFFERDWKRVTESLDGVSKALSDLGLHVSKLEVSVSNIAAMQSSQAALVNTIDRRVVELERDKAIGLGASSERVRIFTFTRAGIVALAGVAGFLAHYLPRLFS